MITFPEIYDILRKEKYSEALQQLPKNFLEEVSEYIAEKKKILEREEGKDLFSDTIKLTRKQLDNAITTVKEILTLRQKKVLNLAFTAALTGVSKTDTENLLSYEKELFESVLKKLKQIQKEIFDKLNRNENNKKEEKNILVRFIEDSPAFVNADGKEIGPFKKGDIVNLPKEVALILIADKKAVAVE